ncbi:MAG: hypothetical protein E7612_02050 [Ruminococcaceae bacterium]|nr:hypothetical protein [Oscillospiraceae bacterium]
MTKEKYIELMEKISFAYSNEDLFDYFSSVKETGITEHGFPRIVANIGILISHGKRMDLYDFFIEIMDFCCADFLRLKKRAQGNDFSVKEIIFCIMELEKSNAVSKEKIVFWKSLLAKINYKECYNSYAETEEACPHNWALFTAVSEFMREHIHVAETCEFVDIQIATQLKRLDENKMYRDFHFSKTNPIVYDIVPRGLMAVLMHFGYNGKFKNEIDGVLRKAGLLTLDMQSVSGELPYGGRSNQFLHNESQVALILEYEADRYYKEGNFELAGRFKRGASKAVADIEKWLARDVITHVKNNYPLETEIGCEGYAYFNKYMIGAASFLYVAYLFCNDSIVSVETDDEPKAFSLSKQFNKTFLKNKKFFVEIDEDADLRYDSKGIGRIHFKGAPSPLCLSMPGTATPNYKVGTEENVDFSFAPGVMNEEEILFATRENAEYILKDLKTETDGAYVRYDCHFSNWKTVSFGCEINNDCVTIKVDSNKEKCLMLPVFYSDGLLKSEIKLSANTLEVYYGGWICRYKSQSQILPLGKRGVNKNGEYDLFYTVSDKEICVQIEFQKVCQRD